MENSNDFYWSVELQRYVIRPTNEDPSWKSMSYCLVLDSQHYAQTGRLRYTLNTPPTMELSQAFNLHGLKCVDGFAGKIWEPCSELHNFVVTYSPSLLNFRTFQEHVDQRIGDAPNRPGGPTRSSSPASTPLAPPETVRTGVSWKDLSLQMLDSNPITPPSQAERKAGGTFPGSVQPTAKPVRVAFDPTCARAGVDAPGVAGQKTGTYAEDPSISKFGLLVPQGEALLSRISTTPAERCSGVVLQQQLTTLAELQLATIRAGTMITKKVHLDHPKHKLYFVSQEEKGRHNAALTSICARDIDWNAVADLELVDDDDADADTKPAAETKKKSTKRKTRSKSKSQQSQKQMRKALLANNTKDMLVDQLMKTRAAISVDDESGED